MKKKATLIHGLIPLCVLSIVILSSVVIMKVSLHVPLIIGILVSGVVAWSLGWTWEEILGAMLNGINQSLEAMLILLLIGMLTASWVAAGTVPTIIYYGLRLIGPSYFLPSVFALCTLISLFIGSWGAAGTIGVAFMSMGQALGVPVPAVAGAVVAGAYVGDKMSPFSDGTNMAAAVAGADIISMIHKMLPLALPVWVVSLASYYLIGLRWNEPSGTITTDIPSQLDAVFHIGAVPLLPIFVLVLCIFLHVPSLISILSSSFSAGFIAVVLQRTPLANVITYMTDGYVSTTGIDAIDALLSVGGIGSMLHTISIILLSMSFGGIMRSTGLMEALVSKIVAHIRTAGGIICLTIFSCIGVNILFPDQYLGMAIPGQMYAERYKELKISNDLLGNVIGAGAAVTSPLVPWNNCGVYMATVLGASTLQYIPYAIFSYLLPIVVIIYGFTVINRQLSRQS